MRSGRARAGGGHVYAKPAYFRPHTYTYLHAIQKSPLIDGALCFYSKTNLHVNRGGFEFNSNGDGTDDRVDATD